MIKMTETNAMSDITVWLRDTASVMGLPHKDKLNEAADELEQLRKDLRTAILGDSAELTDAKKEIERLRERLAKMSDDNTRIRQSIKEYVSNSTRITNDMLREMYEREEK